ncbi:MAG: tetratricopeptide repeat protein [Acidobacteriota bacterium]
MTSSNSTSNAEASASSDVARRPAPPKRRYRKAVGPRLAKLLAVVFALFALLAVNSSYLIGVSILETVTGETYQNWFYLNMFLVHLVLGIAIVVPVIVFGIVHWRNTHDRRNRRAVKVGYALFAAALVLLASGVVLTRLDGILDVKNPTVRSVAYWAHVITPFIVAWLFVLHRLAGKKIRWQVGRRWAVVAAVFAGVLVLWQAQDPRRWDVEGPKDGEQYFFPSLARTATGDFIPERVLQNDAYCAECHQDSHETWAASMHKFSSFNNPPYLFSVRNTRAMSLARDGDVRAARFCAGCHDPVVFFSGKFDDPNFDDVHDPTAQAGITCTTCHAITNLNSVRGNADYTIEEPIHYPFAFSEQPALAWVNRQLVMAKPELHKRTFLKPLHSTPEFCGSCHKVHLPEELNGYKWLRGQNHYDSFLLSGVSGHGASSFYYPDVAEPSCNGCHMPTMPSAQFAARDLDGDGTTEIHDHQFPSANTAIPQLVGLPSWVNEKHRAFNEGVMRLDIFALREGESLAADPIAPLRPELPTLEPGGSYLLDIVVRTLKMGHLFTQGTADSNEVWLDVRLVAEEPGGRRVIGRSGGLGERNAVDPWSHFVNSYVLDREGRRIDRRNAEDIFVALYNHQIPPGAADSIHYAFELPEDLAGPVTVEARLQYRKFDATYFALFSEGDGDADINDLPILTLAEDRITLPVRGASDVAPQTSPIIPWQRWNDYGIGLLRKGGKAKGELRHAEAAFDQVEALGRPDGPLNLARVYLAQGTVRDRAIEALGRAAAFDPPAPRWTVAWLAGQVNQQNGFLDEAIADFRGILSLDDAETRRRGFDFSKDYRVWTALGQTLFERARQERGERRRERRLALLEEAREAFEQVLQLDPEHVAAHYNLDLILKQLGRTDEAAEHFADYLKYKPDDTARGQAVAAARAADPAADRASEAIVVYDLQRSEAPELGSDPSVRRSAPFELRAIAEPTQPPPVDGALASSPRSTADEAAVSAPAS